MLDFHRTVIELFNEQVKKTPDNVALKDDNGITVTYEELNKRSNQLAHWLQKQNVFEGDFVSLILKASIENIICLLGIIKVGAVYVPIDAKAPSQRINHILSDIPSKMIIATKQDIFLDIKGDTVYGVDDVLCLSSVHSTSFICPVLDATRPFCMFYTSGSTGTPKGVIISNAAVVNLNKFCNVANIKHNTVVVQFSNLAFDAVTFEVWGALLNGATLLIVTPFIKQDYKKLKTTLFENHADCILLPTSYFNQIISIAPDTLDKLQTILFGGEQINVKLVKDFLNYRNTSGRDVTLIHVYGPTEATTFICYNIIANNLHDDELLASIGKPISNVRTYVLDEQLNEVSKGTIGELHISGINLAIGYNNSIILDDKKFILNPFCDEKPYKKLYKTGDMVKQLSSGELLYTGRIDDQVKINGYRVHLNEIELQLLKHPLITFAAVIVEKGGNSHNLLTAYITFSSKDIIISASKIRDFLSKSLPFYMLPSKYLKVEAMPLTNIGKINKKDLNDIPFIDLTDKAVADSFSFVEEELKSIWCYLLKIEVIDVDKNLYELGANSLIILQASHLINKALNIQLPIATIMANPSIHKLSTYIEVGVEDGTNNIRDGKIEPYNVAIVGFSCRYPNSNSPDEYWKNLCDGLDCLTNFKEISNFDNVENNKLQPHFVPIKGVISDIDQFDAGFFGFSPSDASALDPQQRIFLECAWEALEYSGNVPSSDKTISIFCGMADSSYLQENLLKNKQFNQQNDWFNTRVSTSIGTLSTQVSYRLDLKGKSININTACSTGLVAVDQACQDLILGHSEIALAGGVSVDVHQRDGYFYQENGIESVDGKCKPFAEDASGTIFSDGVGVVVLKRLDDAIKDNDTIFAVIKGCGISNDGSDKVGYTAPSIKGQAKCIDNALNQSRVNPEDVGFVEAHGTATALGDVIEVSALTEAYRSYTQKTQYCNLGSVKSNIGHTDISAGIAGLIKASFCLYHKKIPPTLYFETPNPNINLATSPFFVSNKLSDWSSDINKRYAGVSAFGVGGTNAHVILEEYANSVGGKSLFKNKLIVVSAKTKKALDDSTTQLIEYLKNKVSEKTNTEYLADMAYTLQTGRKNFPWRCVAVGDSTECLIERLRQSQLVHYDKDQSNSPVFMFSGQGTQYKHMAIQFLENIPYFASLVAQCNNIAREYLEHDIIEIINDDELLAQTKYVQPALFIIEYALAKLIISYGVTPRAFIGHSIGEYVAACIAGIFSLEDAIKLVCKRGSIMSNAYSGEMIAIECNVEEFYTLKDKIKVDLALHNSINNSVAAGLSEDVELLENRLKQKDIMYKKLKVNSAFHSYLMEESRQQFQDYLAEINLSVPLIPIVSNVTGTWLTDHEATDPEYWGAHIVNTVQFNNGITTLINENFKIFIEVGPGYSLSSFVKEIAKENKESISVTNTLPNYSKTISDEQQLLTALGTVWQNGININWKDFYNNEKRMHVPLPTYPFQRKSYWVEPDTNNFAMAENLDIKDWFYQPTWTLEQDWALLKEVQTDAKDYIWIIFKNQSTLSDSIIEVFQKSQLKFIIIEKGVEYKKIHSQKYYINPSEKSHYISLLEDLKARLKHPPIILNLFSYVSSESTILSPEEVDLALDSSFFSLLYTTQACLDVIYDIPLKCLIITNGTQKVLRADVMNPVNASLTGICRVIPQEHSLLSVQMLDVNINDIDNNAVAVAIVNSCLDEWSKINPIAAIRDGYYWKLKYSPIKLKQKMNYLEDHGVYLFTGGLGGIVLTLCEAIAKQINKPIFYLMSRHGLPPRSDWDSILQNKLEYKLHTRIKSIRNLESLGATVHIVSCDVTEFKSMKLVVDEIIKQYHKITGIIHAAGIAGGGLVQLKTKEQAYNVLAPKVHGTYNLAKALVDIPVKFVALCSSVSSLINEAGQVDYCGANACLDAFASSGFFESQHVVSINWNTWQSVGMAVETDRPDDITFFDRGNDITPVQGQDLFMKIMETDCLSQVAISKYDINKFAETSMQQHTQETVLQTKILRDDLEINNTYIEPIGDIEKQLVALWQDTLNIEQIGTHDDFFTLGGHSLKALRIIAIINKKFSCNLTLQDIYENRTVAQITSKISQNNSSNVVSNIVPLKVEANYKNNLFIFHPVGGMIFCYNNLSSQLTTPISIYGVQDSSITTDKFVYSSVLEMAATYLQEIKQLQPTGPYYLLGYSFGGTVAYEVANLLYEQNESVNMLGMIDGWSVFSEQQNNESEFKKMMHQYNPELSECLINMSWQRMNLLLNHKPTKTQQNIVLFKATQVLDEYQHIDDEFNGWKQVTNGAIDMHSIIANHETIIDAENSAIIAGVLSNYLKNN